jgi:hypothetical protein
VSARLSGRLLVVAPALIVLGVAVVLVLSHGGYAPTNWYPAGLFVLALLAVLLAAGDGPRWTGRFRLALVAYALFVGWCYLTILWADVPALAWDGANRSLVYGMVLAVVGLRRWSPGELRIALGVVAGVCTAIAVGTLIAGAGSNPAGLFLEGRLADPMGYANATPNLWLLGCFPALWLAIDRRVPWALRGAALAVAGLLAQMSLLSQSRGAIAAFLLVSLLFVVASPRRWAALAALASAVGVTLATSGPVLRVHDASASHEIGPLLDAARTAILLGTAAMLVVGLAAAAADARLARERRLGANTRRGNLALAALAGVVAVAAIVAVGNPSTWIGDRWEDFKSSGYAEVDRPGQTRLSGSLGSQRYDVYRVALHEFADHPIAGVGVDSYGPGYLLEGKTDQNPRYAHSLVMSLLAETGIVGTALFAAFAALMIAALTGVGRRLPDARGPVLGATAGAAMFFAGAMFDWLWQFPALAFLGFLLLGVAANTAGPEDPPTPPAASGEAEPSRSAWTLRTVWPRLLGAAAVFAAAVSLILPGIAERFTDAAYETAANDPRLAVDRLDRAADLNPLSVRPLLAKNVVLRRLGDRAGANAALDEAETREPDNWFIPFERALLHSAAGEFDDALADLRQAKALNPRQVVIDLVTKETARGDDYGSERAEAQLASQTARKLQPTG